MSHVLSAFLSSIAGDTERLDFLQVLTYNNRDSASVWDSLFVWLIWMMNDVSLNYLGFSLSLITLKLSLISIEVCSKETLSFQVSCFRWFNLKSQACLLLTHVSFTSNNKERPERKCISWKTQVFPSLGTTTTRQDTADVSKKRQVLQSKQ